MQVYHIYSDSNFLNEIHQWCDENLTTHKWIERSILDIDGTSDTIMFHCCWAHLFSKIELEPTDRHYPYIIVKKIFDDYDDEMM